MAERVFPWWGSGLKYTISVIVYMPITSLPLVGKWIEIGKVKDKRNDR